MNKSESKYYNTALLMDEALLQLLEQKEFEFITVKEICQKAGVNRSTFYLHYENTNDLLVEAIGVINKKFMESFAVQKIDVNKASKEDLNFISKDFLTPYLGFVKENKRVFKLIHDKPHIFNANQVSSKLYTDLFEIILSKYGVKENERVYIFEFFSKGTLAVIMKWVANDCKDDMDLISNIVISIMGR